MSTRRYFLYSAAALAVSAPLWLRQQGGEAMAAGTDLKVLQDDWQRWLPADAELPDPSTALNVTEEEWRQRLDQDAFDVLFREDTERPGSSPLDDEKREGVFTCAACDLPLFTSAMKYDSGTGWPSFFTAIPEHLATSTDYKLVLPRTEYHCVRCGGHQGHRFSDGPDPTGERWCNNGVALKFLAKA